MLGTSAQGPGVEGRATNGPGVSGRNDGGVGVSGDGVVGVSGTSANGTGVRGAISSTGVGVEGTSANGTGVVTHGGGSFGIGILADGTAAAVVATSPGMAGIFTGNVDVQGTLTRTDNRFKIDHPADPENRYLAHSTVESPEMKNLYDGVVTLDEHGGATVELPDWFEPLNETYRYQLTPIGAPAPNLHVSRKLADRHFTIAGGVPRAEVCWQITGVRHDAWARTHPLVVEENKKPEERGYYLHPEVQGQPAERSLGALQHKQFSRH
ncbi:hypothetical protein ACWCXK_31395 [Streptomyces sp. NPDC001739]